MKVSPIAHHAWLRFLEFINDEEIVFAAIPVLREHGHASEKLDGLKYGSDWLHLWLLSGDAAVATSARFEAYMTVMTTLAVRLDQASLFRPGVEAMWPPLTPPQRPKLSDLECDETHWPTVPASSTREMFDLCSSEQIMCNIRSALAIAFLASPGASRFRCA